MKKSILLLALITVFYSCKNEGNKSEEGVANEDSIEKLADKKITMYSGDFVYTADAAVIKGPNFIYGVKLDSMAAELANRVKPAKQTDYDMVPVVVSGELNPKPEGQEGWDEILTIQKIITVGNKPAKIDLNIEEKKN